MSLSYKWVNFAHGASQKWTALTLQPPSGMYLKENKERKWTELKAAGLNIYFVRKKWPKIRLYIYLLLHYKSS